jgi:hypothetical protein
MSIFPSDAVLAPPKCHMCIFSWLSGCHQRPSSEVRGRSHVLIFSHAATAEFLKALWPRKEKHGMNDAHTERSQGVISLFIPPGRKKWVQGNGSILQGLGMRKSSGRNGKQHSRPAFVHKWEIKSEAIVLFSKIYILLLKNFIPPYFPVPGKASQAWVRDPVRHILKTGFIPHDHSQFVYNLKSLRL